MHPRAFARGGGGVGQLADGVRLVHADRQIMFHAPRQFRFLAFAQQQQGRGDARVAQRHGLFQRAQAQAASPFFQRDPHHVHRPVPVGFVLDHGEQTDRRGKFLADELQIAPQPAQVNLDPRRPQRKSIGMHVHQFATVL